MFEWRMNEVHKRYCYSIASKAFLGTNNMFRSVSYPLSHDVSVDDSDIDPTRINVYVWIPMSSYQCFHIQYTIKLCPWPRDFPSLA